MRSLTRRLARHVLRFLPQLWYDPAARASRLSGPVVVQLQTVDRCNGSCPTCPYKAAANPGAPRLMEDDLYLHILNGMRGARSLRVFTLMLQNEPLMDLNLARRVRQAKEVLGRRVVVGTVTNGSLLTPQRADELLEAGLDELHVSIDAARAKTYRIVRPGLDFARVVQNVNAILHRTRRTRVTVRFLKQQANQGEEREFARYWRLRGANVRLLPLINRAGTLDRFEELRRKDDQTPRSHLRRLEERLSLGCNWPFVRLAVLVDGRVILCCQDWGHCVIFGDLSKQSLTEVWNGGPMNYYRHLLWTRRYDESPACRNCSLVRDRTSSYVSSNRPTATPVAGSPRAECTALKPIFTDSQPGSCRSTSSVHRARRR